MAGVTFENVRAYRARWGIPRGWTSTAGRPKARAAAVSAPSAKSANAAQAGPAAQEATATKAVGAAPEPKAKAVEGAAPVPRVEAAPKPRAAALSQGFTVETRDEDGVVVNFIVVAANVADAAPVAQGAMGTARPGAQITAIRHLGPGLS